LKNAVLCVNEEKIFLMTTKETMCWYNIVKVREINNKITGAIGGKLEW